MKTICIVGISGKLGLYMVQHAWDRGYEVVGVCGECSMGKFDKFKGRVTVFTGALNDCALIKRALQGCDGILAVLMPWGVSDFSSGTVQASLKVGGWIVRQLRVVDLDDQVEACKRIFASSTCWTVVRVCLLSSR